MASTSKTIYTHTCDLCGTVTDKEALRQLYGPLPGGLHAGTRPPQVDICPECTSRPISEALAFLAPPDDGDTFRILVESSDGRAG